MNPNSFHRSDIQTKLMTILLHKPIIIKDSTWERSEEMVSPWRGRRLVAEPRKRSS